MAFVQSNKLWMVPIVEVSVSVLVHRVDVIPKGRSCRLPCGMSGQMSVYFHFTVLFIDLY